jgi:glycine/sarcosine N-methyltransferase
MKFYDELSKVYDIVFRKEDNTVKFLNDTVKPEAKILDLACGTGTYSIELAERGHDVTGTDLDGEMIRMASIKKPALNIRFMEGDMRKAKNIFQGESFGLIFCIGNSLVHLKNIEEIKCLMSDIYSMLNEDGCMVLQIINYDRIIKNNVTSLPTIDRSDEGVKFVRNYRYEESIGVVHFDTELIINKEGKEGIYKNSVPLLALGSEELISVIKETGFSKIKATAGFSEKDFDSEAYALVVRAYK